MFIYIVEDDTDIRELETYALKNSGYEVKSFGESKSFFKACAEIKPQLVILDVMLPDFDGLSVLEKLRKDKSTKNIPVILAIGPNNPWFFGKKKLPLYIKNHDNQRDYFRYYLLISI